MAGKQNITLQICGKIYPFTIDSEKEEVYRMAADMVNSNVAEYAKHAIENYTAKDFLALTAFKFARDGIFASQSREVGNEDVVALNELSERITDFMNGLSDGKR